jgi:hypothetical protein
MTNWERELVIDRKERKLYRRRDERSRLMMPGEKQRQDLTETDGGIDNGKEQSMHG